MMGEVGFVALGIDWTQARITHNWSLRLNTECTPLERHAVLYFIEQGLMTQDRQALRMGGGRRVGQPADARRSRITTGPTRCCTPRSAGEWYIPQIGEWKQALGLRRRNAGRASSATGRRSATRA